MIDALVAALRAEFAGEVTFQPNVPKQVQAPSIIVSPGEPFLEPREAASPIVWERWVVLVAVSIKNMAAGLAQMRVNSLRVRRAVNTSGGVWDSASGPRRLEGETAQNSETVVSLNLVHFRYDANGVLDESP